MRCSTCKLDLTGRSDDRCLNCGATLLAPDPLFVATDEKNDLNSSVPLWTNPKSLFPLACFTCTLAFGALATTPCQIISLPQITSHNLREIAFAWKQQLVKQNPEVVEAESIRSQIRNFYCPGKQRDRIERHLRIARSAPGLGAAIIAMGSIGGIASLISRQRGRRPLRYLRGVAAVTVIVGLVVYYLPQLNINRVEHSRDYFDDFTYKRGVSESRLGADDVIAYQKQEWDGERCVAFGSGAVMYVSTDEFRRLEQEQGIEIGAENW